MAQNTKKETDHTVLLQQGHTCAKGIGIGMK